MIFLWSSLAVHYSVTLVLGALAVAGMDWSGENVGALRGASVACGSGLRQAENVRSADIVSAESVAISLRRAAVLVAAPTICHEWAAMGDQVRGVLGDQSRGGGGRAGRRPMDTQYIAPETKFYDCEGCFDSGKRALNGCSPLPFPWFWDQKKRKGAAA